MILLIAVLAGLLAGCLRAKLGRRVYASVPIRHIWMVILAYLPQFFAFSLPATRAEIPDQWVAIILVSTQALLLLFIWLNRSIPGGWLMGLGLSLNFLVIILNGGLMPLSPANARLLLPDLPAGNPLPLVLGERVGASKDILLEVSDTHLWFLSDIFHLPAWMGYPLVFSMGDVCLALGAFWLFWQLGAPPAALERINT